MWLDEPLQRVQKTLFTAASTCQLFLSLPMIAEIFDVLQRPELSGKFKSLKGMDVRIVLDLLSQAAIVEIPVKIHAVSCDPKDNTFLATARQAQADYLVTEDEDLLLLTEYEGAKIITAQAFLALLHREQVGHDGYFFRASCEVTGSKDTTATFS